MQIRALKKVSFSGTRHNAGDCFEVDEKMGNHLIANKLAEIIIEPVVQEEEEVVTVPSAHATPPVTTEPTSQKEELFHNKRKKK